MGYNPNIYQSTNSGRGYLVSGSPLTDSSSSGSGIVYFGGIGGAGTIGICASASSGNVTSNLFGFNQLSFPASGLASGVYDFYVYPNTSNVLTIGASAWPTITTTPSARQTLSNGYTYIGTPSQRFVFTAMVSGGVVKDWVGSRWISNINNQINKPLSGPYLAIQYATTTTGPINNVDGAGRVSFICQPNSPGLVFNAVTTTSQNDSATQSGFGIGIDNISSSSFFNFAYIGTNTGFVSQGTIAVTGEASFVGFHYVCLLISTTQAAGASNFQLNQLTANILC